jgi:hypothetical protein
VSYTGSPGKRPDLFFWIEQRTERQSATVQAGLNFDSINAAFENYSPGHRWMGMTAPSEFV